MSVQTLKFGDNLPSASSLFVRVKNKGEQVQFQIAQPPVYDGKHFIEISDPDTGEIRWEVTECPRIAEGEECEKCIKYFKQMAMIKKFKQAEGVADDNSEVKKMKSEARRYAVSIQFYFPILNRNDGKFGILQVTNGVRNKLNAQYENGIEVMEKEWILRNTGSKSPAERYALSLVDSADVKPFSEEEEAEWEKAKSYDLSLISSAGADSSDE